MRSDRHGTQRDGTLVFTPFWPALATDRPRGARPIWSQLEGTSAWHHVRAVAFGRLVASCGSVGARPASASTMTLAAQFCQVCLRAPAVATYLPAAPAARSS